MTDAGSPELERFLRELWADFDGGRLRAVEDYIARYPGLEVEVREEHAACTAPLDEGASSASGIATPRLQGGEPGVDASQEAPTRIGRYEVTSHLAKGGMSLLLEARDPELHRRVVLKTLPPLPMARRTAALRRLMREARILGRLPHEGICPVLDVLTEGERIYVVMPFIDGETLEERIRRALAEHGGAFDPRLLWGTFSDRGSDAPASEADTGRELTEEARSRGADLRPVLRFLERVASIVHLAHERGIVHRDLKPGNLMIRPQGDPVVLDFGLGVDVFGDQGERLTEEGDMLGTPHSMAPEQVEGRIAEIDRRTDVYALGVVLYELLTGRRPFEGPTKKIVLASVLRGDPVPPRKIVPSLPRDLEAVCLKAMAVEPGRRYGTALELAEDLRRIRTLQPTVAKPLSTVGRLLRRVRRNPWSSAALALCVAFGGIALFQWNRARSFGAGAELVRSIVRSCQGQPLSAEDVETLRRHVPDQKGLDVLLRQLSHPDVPTGLVDILKRVVDEYRSPGERRGSGGLISPRATVADLSPSFHFEAAGSGAGLRRFLLMIESESGEKSLRSFPVVRAPGQPDPVVWALPGEEVLRPDVAYRWFVRLDPEAHPDEAPFWSPTPAHFHVVDPALRGRILASVRPTGSASLDALLRASTVLGHGLASDALQELASNPGGAFPEERNLRTLLLAEAHAKLGDAERIEDLRRVTPTRPGR
jgi:serine/threonine protein kinase